MVDYSRDENEFCRVKRIAQHEGDGSFRNLDEEKVSNLIMKIAQTE